ncbi:MAG: hypothetical protein HY327_08385 [Chloroflexi bacterium]|nr:hypothetical protein [Chloroflexota bacterium]
MAKQTFQVSDNVRIVIRNCKERVGAYGGDAGIVTVEGDEANAARQEGDAILIERATDVMVIAPRTAVVTIEECDADVRLVELAGLVGMNKIDGDVALRDIAGDVMLRDLEGDLTATRVKNLKGEGVWNGDVALRSVENLDVAEIEEDVSIADAGVVKIQAVRGDVSARDLRGDLQIGEARKDVSLREVAGAVHIAHARGDLIANALCGALNAPEIEGDAVISVAGVGEINLRADGDVVLNLPADTNADLELLAPHGDLVVPASVSRARGESEARGTLGNGGTRVRAESTRGDLVLRVGELRHGHRHERHAMRFGPEFAAMGAEIAADARKIGMEVRRQVRESLVDSMGDWRAAKKVKHRVRFGHVHEEDDAEEMPRAEKPRGPAAGSPDRQTILDAVARGEMNVDDAIKKIRGEE